MSTEAHDIRAAAARLFLADAASHTAERDCKRSIERRDRAREQRDEALKAMTASVVGLKTGRLIFAEEDTNRIMLVEITPKAGATAVGISIVNSVSVSQPHGFPVPCEDPTP